MPLRTKTNNRHETWKWITGYEYLYLVSDQGRVKHVAYRDRYNILHDERMSRLFMSQSGSQVVDLFYKSHRARKTVGHLVAREFLPNPNHYPNVIHKDGNAKNNEVSNLVWTTSHHGEKRINQKIDLPPEIEVLQKITPKKHQRKKIIATSITHDQQIFNSVLIAAKELDLDPADIQAILNGYKKTTFGYTFKYKEN